jgi:hypothetical protein
LNVGTEGADWAHANAVIYDDNDDSFMISIRHQDAVIKIARTSGALRWILAPPANWSPELEPYLLTPVGDPFEWPYHQHAPMLTSNGTVVMFDNGNHRASPPDPGVGDSENYSRAVEYAIDEEAMTVEQVWEYGASSDERLYSDFIGDADQLPSTGNVLIVFGGIGFIDGERADTSDTHNFAARILEVSHESPARKLFELRIDDEVDGVGGWTVARATRIRDLYRDE